MVSYIVMPAVTRPSRSKHQNKTLPLSPNPCKKSPIQETLEVIAVIHQSLWQHISSEMFIALVVSPFFAIYMKF